MGNQNSQPLGQRRNKKSGPRPNTPGLCTWCGVHPQLVDRYKTHPYCGTFCRDAALGRGVATGPAAHGGQAASVGQTPILGRAASVGPPSYGLQPPYGGQAVYGGQPSHGGQAVSTGQATNLGRSTSVRPVQAFGQTVSSSHLCIVCGTFPKYREGTKVHDYCGLTCAAMDLRSEQMQPQPPPPPILRGPLCTLQGCSNPVWIDPAGIPSQFCRRAHRDEAMRRAASVGSSAFPPAGAGTVPFAPALPASPPAPAPTAPGPTACIQCHSRPVYQNSPFCGQTCAQQAVANAPCVVEVPQGHPCFTSVSKQFTSTWKHSTKCPTVRYVYKVMVPQALMANYHTYQAAVQAAGMFVPPRSEGNECRRFHGTVRACHLGEPGQTTLCAAPSCSLCSIIRTSFDISKSGSNTSWGRFGRGIYTSATSSKSNDYSRNTFQSPLKSMLLNKVVVGKGHKLKSDSPSLAGPPAGFDSVLGEPGGSLNYDECVVYNKDAVRPSWLIIYQP